MSKLDDIIKKLEAEKFNNEKINWNVGHWGDVNVKFTQDSKDFYFIHGNVIWRQPIEGRQEERIPQCYDCNSEMEIQKQHNSVWYSDGPGPCAGSGEVKVKFIPYCNNCENKPGENGVIYKSIYEVY